MSSMQRHGLRFVLFGAVPKDFLEKYIYKTSTEENKEKQDIHKQDNNMLNNNDIQHHDRSNIKILEFPSSTLPCYEIIASQSELDKIQAEFFRQLTQQTAENDTDFWTLWNIRHYIPEIWADTSEAILPHHINLPTLQGVSFKKGCFLGQEIIARMEHRGGVKRHMVKAVLKKNSENGFEDNSEKNSKNLSLSSLLPKPGSDLYSSKEDFNSSIAIGKIISIASCTDIPAVKAEALIEMLKTETIKKVYTEDQHCFEIVE